MKTYTYKFLVVIFSLIFLGSSLSKASAADFMAALLAEDLTTEQVNLVQRKVSHLFTGTKVTENLQWLRQMGVSDVGRVITLYPPLLGLSIQQKLNPIVEWIKAQGVKDVARVITLFPALLGYSISDNLAPKIEWLKSLGVTDIAKILNNFPQIFGYSIQSTLEPKLNWLRSQGVDDVERVISLAPQFFGLSIEDKLDPLVEWLRLQGVSNIGKLLSACPQIFSYSLRDNLIPKINWLKAQGVVDIGKVISTYPALLGYSIKDKLNQQISWLKSQGIKDIEKLITAYPAVLGYSIADNLSPSLDELRTHWGLSVSDIERQPMLLGASLKRIQALRKWMNLLSRVAGQGDFVFSQLEMKSKKVCIQSLSPELLLQHLKDARIVRVDRSLEELIESNMNVLSQTEKQNLISVFANGDFEKLLVQKGNVTAKSLATIGAYCQKVLK